MIFAVTQPPFPVNVRARLTSYLLGLGEVDVYQPLLLRLHVLGLNLQAPPLPVGELQGSRCENRPVGLYPEIRWVSALEAQAGASATVHEIHCKKERERESGLSAGLLLFLNCKHLFFFFLQKKTSTQEITFPLLHKGIMVLLGFKSEDKESERWKVCTDTEKKREIEREIEKETEKREREMVGKESRYNF